MRESCVQIGLKRQAGRLAVAMAIGVLLAAAPVAMAAEGNCATNPHNRALDYWLGDWSVRGPGAAPTAGSQVSLALDGCVVVESWDGGRGHRGENVLAYSVDDKSWHGLFADNEGRVHVFVDGRVDEGSAIFSAPSRGPNGETILNRVEINCLGPDRVEQVWKKSTDNGVTWSIEFHGEYFRKKAD